jgi:predicted negative regulator of RcsB-dependent stress response
MWQPTFAGSSITTRGGDAKVHGRMLPMASAELGELVLGAGQADAEPFDFAEPAFTFGLANAVDEVIADLLQSAVLRRVRPQERTSDAPLTELTTMFLQFMADFR